LIDSETMRELLSWAEATYDLVVVDTPPTAVVSDAIPLLTRVSGVLVVCRLKKTTLDEAHRLRDQLEHLEAPVLGVVANCVPRSERAYAYGYGEPPVARDQPTDSVPEVSPRARRNAPTRVP
jgi:Mrp family chromosome partitioning ATPase